MADRAAALAQLKAARLGKASSAPVDKVPSKSTSTLLSGSSHGAPSSSKSKPPKVLVPSSSSPVVPVSARTSFSSSSGSNLQSRYFLSRDDQEGDPIPRLAHHRHQPASASSATSSFRQPAPSSSSSRASSILTTDEPPRKRPDNSRSASPAAFGGPLEPSANSRASSSLSVTHLRLDPTTNRAVPMELDSESDLEPDPLANLFDEDSPQRPKPSSRPILPLPPGSPISLSSSAPQATPDTDNSDLEILSTTKSSSSSGGLIPNNERDITMFANRFGSLSRRKVEETLIKHKFDADKSRAVLQQMQSLKMARRGGPVDPVVVPSRKRSPAPRAASPEPPSATQTQRRGHESAIYANRKSLGGYGASGVPDGSPKKAKKEKRREQKQDSNSDSDESESDEYGGKKRAIAKWERDEEKEEEDALAWFNSCEHQALLDITTCTDSQATTVLSARPFSSVDDLRLKFTKKRGISQKIFDDYIDIMQGYAKVDAVLQGCELVGEELERAMSVFTERANGKVKGADVAAGDEQSEAAAEGVKDEEDETATDLVAGVEDVEALLEKETDPERKRALKGYIKEQPESMAEGVVLKDYQLLGLNWLNLLYSKGLSCILADEMGLGKTIQVISFLAHLNGLKSTHGPHLIIVPSSTLENWAREFQRFCPDIDVQTYYGSLVERAELSRDLLRDEDVEVVLTTYAIASGTNKDDKRFFKKMGFQTAVFDEGHQLKNYKSARYKSLMGLNVNFRVLLTGTPLQNNLQELVSVLNFILPEYFEDAEDALRAIFKVSTNQHANLLSKQRVSRAQKMMKPFVLRRRKDQVLKDLPKKTTRIEWCDLTPAQNHIYREQETWSAKTLAALAEQADKQKDKKRGREDLEIDNGPDAPKKVGDSGSNVLMNLRKAASHPLLFRTHYTDAKLRVLAKDIMKEPEHMAKDFDLIVEDMEIMSDSELHALCLSFKATRKHALDPSAFLDCGKVDALRKILDGCLASGKRLLLFSMFTQILDILKKILDHLKIKWVILTGTTRVDERQSLVDDFTHDPEIKVFLLSTLAGGMGINLTAASVVVIYDIGFNPHNEKQAADRAHRLGQTREVEIITLLSRGTVDEDINDLAVSKLKLDDAVAGRAGAPTEEEEDEKESEGKMKASLLSKLRVKLDKGVGGAGAGEGAATLTEVKEGDEAGVTAMEIA